VVLTLADMEGNETFDASVLGQAEEVRHRGVHGDYHSYAACREQQHDPQL
jgi:hypothetical protein